MIHSFDVDIAVKYGIEEAILIQNFAFWISKNEANDVHLYDGRYWTYNSLPAIFKLFPEFKSIDKTKRIVKKLIDNGILMKGNYNTSKWDKTSWYAFTEKGMDLISKTKPSMPMIHAADSVEINHLQCKNALHTDNILQIYTTDTNKEDNSNEVSFSKEKSTSMLELSKKKPLSNANCAKERDEEFDRFWVLYDKKIGRDKCERLWARLKKEDKEKIFETLPLYIQSTPDKQFRKNPTTYLNPSEKHWLDEVIQQTPQQRVTNYQKQNDYGNSERNHFRDEEDNRERDYNFTF